MTRARAAAVTLLTVSAALAQDSRPATPPVEQIVAKANHAAYYQAADGRANVTMTITDAAGQKRFRRFTILRRDVPAPEGYEGDPATYDGDQQFYVYFQRPADVAKMAFLVHKHIADDVQDDRWLYLPQLDLVKRISSAEKRTSFVGSDFYYEDVSGRNLADDVHELERVDEARNSYILKNTPTDPDAVEFAYYRMYVHRETFIPWLVIYYDAQQEPIRQYMALKFADIQSEKTGEVHKTVLAAEMRDLKNNSRTTLEYSGVVYDLGIPADVFTERYLRNPPRQWLE